MLASCHSHFQRFYDFRFTCSIAMAQSVKIVRKPLSLEEKV